MTAHPPSSVEAGRDKLSRDTREPSTAEPATAGAASSHHFQGKRVEMNGVTVRPELGQRLLVTPGTLRRLSSVEERGRQEIFSPRGDHVVRLGDVHGRG